MSRQQIAELISAIQQRVAPADRLPPRPPDPEVPAPLFAEDDLISVLPADWERPKPPDWVLGALTPESDLIQVDPDDTVTLEPPQPGGAADISAGPSSATAHGVRAPTPSFDVLAYYLPFHFYRNVWGIFIREAGVLELTRSIVRRNILKNEEIWIADLSTKALFLHEFFHHCVEVACSRLEYPLPTSLLGNDHYSRYFHVAGASYIEEAIANAYVARNIERYYQSMRSRGSYESAMTGLFRIMSHQPAPYSRFREYMRNDQYARWRDVLIDRMYEPWLPDSPPPSRLLGSAVYFSDVTPTATHCPIYLVRDAAHPLIRVARPFPKAMGLQVIVHSLDHPPQHIHIRTLSGEFETRYLWPTLTPYPGDSKLSKRLEKNLRDYVDQHGAEIGNRISRVYQAVAAELR